MDELKQLKYRIIALEGLVRRQDKLLRAICGKLDSSKTDASVLAACKEYLKVFEEENFQKI